MPNDDAVGKGGWGGGENVSKSDDVILVRSLVFALSCYVSHFDLQDALS